MAPPANQSLPPEFLPVMRTVLDAVVVVTQEGRVIGWNAQAEATFGWPSDYAHGRTLSELIVPAQHRPAHEAGLARLAQGDPPRVLDRRIEITALRADGSEFPVELSITHSDTSLGPVFVGFLRDISARRKAEETLKRQVLEAGLMFDVAQMASEADSFEEALKKGLAAICEVSGWPVGHVFVTSPGNPPGLSSTDIWHETDPGVADRLREKTDEIDWKMGCGLPGTILATGKPQWLADTNEEMNFYRKGLGFRSAFGFPLAFEGQTIAILEFFSLSPVEPDPNLLLTVRSLGEQLGRVFERRKRQDREALLVQELHHRIKNTIAVVNAIANQTFRNAVSPEAALQAFLARMHALAQAHNLMFSSPDHEVSLRAAVEAAVTGTGNSLDRFTITGPDVQMPGNVATSIILALHELCTNAMKYGSLSVAEGHVEIAWGRSPQGDHHRFEWRETGGPPVTPPTKEGFGSIFLKRILQMQFGGTIEIAYEREGVRVTSIAPLAPRKAAS